ncbi:NUDIX domain-containing protein [Aeromicrobium duanguangcaii]|uniref:NUDIX domain-containing protein n=1 Tax=Aeromicrobium duanguangcaii TaxID=2968086 RepID=A0ABY5KEZ3_9ACTN|nr:NUDIX domain-containing protein [Aeromicrobium duanguangcaii]MCD9153889.1 NUDIX domain-containing protein [Aeromicrobium duanguangcaii]MCL3837618.1 NUDIX domain-containing protein [Aeromicrobium duanguangcaii]UUI69032.1 NUDIX domain-containing protein [Aeromicrobium duanguangcaii]
MARLLSAGILLHRVRDGRREVLLGHLGGPFWARRHERAWSIPKGVLEDGEEPQDAAAREFLEELGVPVPDGPWVDLGTVRQSKKDVRVWAVEADLDPASVVPGTFDLEWPPGSGTTQAFPELDRVEWFGLDEAAEAIVAAQSTFLERLPVVPD